MKKLAVIGSLSGVGRELLNELAENDFKPEQIVAIEPEAMHSVGKQISFGDYNINVESLAKIDFKNLDIAFFLDDVEVSNRYIPQAIKDGCFSVDGSGNHLKPFDTHPYTKAKIQQAIKNKQLNVPNSVGHQLINTILPIHEKFAIKNASVTILQNTGMIGGMDELFYQTKGVFVNEDPSKHKKIFPKQIAFNVIPEVGEIEESGLTSYENYLVELLGNVFNFSAQVSCIWVPTFVGNSIVVHFTTHEDLTMDEINSAYQNKKNLLNLVYANYNQKGGYATPREASGEDGIFVSRVRCSSKKSGELWSVADSSRAQALALYQIVEEFYNVKSK